MNLRRISSQRADVEDVFSRKWQLLLSFFLALLIFCQQVLLNTAVTSAFLLNLLENTLLFLFLFEGAKWIQYLVEKRFSLFEKTHQHIALSILSAYVFASVTMAVLAYLFHRMLSRALPSGSQLLLEIFIAFLLTLGALAVINISRRFESIKRNERLATQVRMEKYFETLLDNLEDVVQVVNAQNKVIYTSTSVESATGYTVDEIRDREPLFMIHRDDEHLRVNLMNDIKGDSHGSDKLRLRIVTKSQEIKYMDLRTVSAKLNSKMKGTILTLTDVSAEVSQQDILKRQREQYRFLLEVSKSFLKNDFRDSLEETLKNLGKVASVDRVYVYQLNKVMEKYECLHEWRRPDGERFPSLYYNTGLSMHGLDWMTSKLEKGEVIAIEHLEDMPLEAKRLREVFESDSTLSILLIPMKVNNELIGFLGYDTVLKTKHWNDEDITLLQICNEIVTSALIRKNTENEEREKGMALAQLESLKNQVNPHFLFNSLNVLSSLVHIDQNLSEKFIDQLAKSYRYLLEQKDMDLVPLKTEMDFMQSFAFLLQIRFEDKLEIKVNIGAQSMNDLVAPLTLQLLIENAVKHNIVSKTEPLIIEISDSPEGYLTVKNNLQLRLQQTPSTGLGLKNIIERYRLLSDRMPEFRISNNSYVAKIPLIKTAEK
jgi:PAS domain S-box-containing protein